MHSLLFLAVEEHSSQWALFVHTIRHLCTVDSIGYDLIVHVVMLLGCSSQAALAALQTRLRGLELEVSIRAAREEAAKLHSQLQSIGEKQKRLDTHQDAVEKRCVFIVLLCEVQVTVCFF